MSVRITSIRIRKRWVGLALLLAIIAVIGGVRMKAAARPVAVATLIGAPMQADLRGIVEFRHAPGGTRVTVDVAGLPQFRPGTPPEMPPIGPHGFHIHEGASCEVGDAANPFAAAGGHWNPDAQPHGNHAGDFPVLFSRAGRARLSFVTDRFRPEDVVGRSVVIHLNPDDFRTQPAGDSGPRIACGVIEG